MSLNAADEELLLAGVPDGLVARPLRTFRRSEDGELVEVKNRRRQRKTERVELIPAGRPERLAIGASEERWLLDAGQRRWAGVRARYGDGAWARAVELAMAGVVRLRCSVDERMALGQPQGWVLSDEWESRRASATRRRDLGREQLRALADKAAAAVAERCPELAAALRGSSPSNPTTPVLVYAAEDLVEGITHAGPRAFSQAHFEHSKARDDVARILLDAGIPDEVLVELGVRRSARLGVGGPVNATVEGTPVALGVLNGPVLLRADQPGLGFNLEETAPLVIVENLQAAETLADQLPQVPTLYTAGLPGRAALGHMSALGDQAHRVLLIPDADLGGVRIAEAVLRVVPSAELVDVGAMRHRPRAAWPAEGVSVRGLRAALKGPASLLARACLERGYPVEQELAIVEAVKRELA